MSSKILLSTIFIVTILIISGLGFYYFSNKPAQTESEITAETPKVDNKVEEKKPEVIKTDFTLVKKNGVVMYKSDASSSYKNLESTNIELKYGSFVKTDKDSEAHVVFKNNSVMTVAKESEVQVNGEENKMQINQIIGRTWHRIIKLKASETYEVKTETAIAAVRGTTFDVEVKKTGVNLASEISLLEGEIDCKQLTKEGDKYVEKASQIVKPNTTVTINDFKVNKNWNKRTIPASKKSEEWYKENQKIDVEFREKGGDSKPKEMLLDKFIEKVKGISTVREEVLDNSKTTPDNKVIRGVTDIIKDEKKKESDNEEGKIDDEKPDIDFYDINLKETLTIGKKIKFLARDNEKLNKIEIKLNGSPKAIRECKDIDKDQEFCEYTLQEADIKNIFGVSRVSRSAVLKVRAEASDKQGNESSTENVFNLTIAPEPTPTPTPVELPVISFENKEARAGERADTNFTQPRLVLSKKAESDIQINISYNDNNPTKGQDFEIDINNLVIRAGSDSIDIPVHIKDDQEVEDIETLMLTINNSDNYTVGSNNTYQLLIEDDDTIVANRLIDQGL